LELSVHIEQLNTLFYPQSVAIVGASNDSTKAGYHVLNKLMNSGYRGGIYAVNKNGGTIHGLEVYKSVLDIPGRVDVLVITVKAEIVKHVLLEARKREDIRGAVIIPGGFKENGREGEELENSVVEIAGSAGIRIVGPNCVGILNSENCLNTTLADFRYYPGETSLLVQSGGLGSNIVWDIEADIRKRGIAKFTHLGNSSDITFSEIIDYYTQDDKTKVIAVHIEGLPKTRGTSFLDSLKKAAEAKPTIILKTGRTELGTQATLSHTGSLAGSDNMYTGIFDQFGVNRVDTTKDLLNVSKVFEFCTIPENNRMCIITQTGGSGVMASDIVAGFKDVKMGCLTDKTVNALREKLPGIACINNPPGYIDATGAANEENHKDVLEIVAQDEHVDALLLISALPVYVDTDTTVECIIEAKKNIDKPLVVCLTAGSGTDAGRRRLEDNRIPTYSCPEDAAIALSHLVYRAAFLERKRTK